MFAKIKTIFIERNSILVGYLNMWPLNIYNEPSQVYCIISGGRNHQNTKGWTDWLEASQADRSQWDSYFEYTKLIHVKLVDKKYSQFSARKCCLSEPRLYKQIRQRLALPVSSIKIQVSMCAHRRLRSACAVWSKSSMGALWVARGPSFLQAQN